MKIAICLSGFLRNWEIVKDSFCKFLHRTDIHDIDVFIHTYEDNSFHFTSGLANTTYNIDKIQEMFQGINIRKLETENSLTVTAQSHIDTQKFSSLPNFQTLSPDSFQNPSMIQMGVRYYDQMRKIYLCNELRKTYERENEITYDLVVRTRPDLLYFSSPIWENLIDNCLHISLGLSWGYPDDAFGIATPQVMDAYSNRFIMLEELFFGLPPGNLKETFNCHCPSSIPCCSFDSHAILTHCLVHYGFTISQQRSINASIVRGIDKIHLSPVENGMIDCKISELVSFLEPYQNESPETIEYLKRFFINNINNNQQLDDGNCIVKS